MNSHAHHVDPRAETVAMHRVETDTPGPQRSITPNTSVRLTLGQICVVLGVLASGVIWCTTVYLKVERMERVIRILAEKQGVVIP